MTPTSWAWLLLLRVSLIGFIGGVFIYVFNVSGSPFLIVGLFLVILVALYESWFFLNHIQREEARFLATTRYADSNQKFEFKTVGVSLKKQRKIIMDTFVKLLKNWTDQSENSKQLKAVIENTPVPVLSLSEDGSVQLKNSAARQLLGLPQVTKIEGLKQFGDDFFKQVSCCTVGESKLAHFSCAGFETKVIVSVSEMKGNKGIEKLVSIQDVGGELGLSALLARQKLVEVMADEVESVIAPIASLSKSLVNRLNETALKQGDGALLKKEQQKQQLEAISAAVNTMAFKAEGLDQFFLRHSNLACMSIPQKESVKVAEIFDYVTKVILEDKASEACSIEVVMAVMPQQLEIFLNREYIELLLISLLKHIKQVLRKQANAKIKLLARKTQGERVMIELIDNGPSIQTTDLSNINILELYSDVSRDGRRIDLAFAQQVMLLHKARFSAVNLKTAGVKFTLLF